MLLPQSADPQSLLEDHFERRLFTRRTDLTNGIRLTIATHALHAMMNGVWRMITKLADEYSISRPFVYSLANTLKEAGQFLFGEAATFIRASSAREHSIQMMLSLRLEGRSSIGAIATIMNLQHLPELHFRQVHHYGLFSNAKRTELLRKARQLLAQRKKRRPTPETWVQRRQAAGDRKPLSCPRCGHLMELWCLVFRKPQLIAQLLGIETEQKIPPNTLLSRADVSAVTA